MLASTVQFSSYDESLRIPHRQPPPGPRQPTADHRTSGTTGTKPPQRQHPTPSPGAGPFPQDPTACLPPAPTHHHVPHHPPGGGRTSGGDQVTGRTGQRSTLELRHEHRHPPPTGASITVRARPWTSHRDNPDMTGQRSLERR